MAACLQGYGVETCREGGEGYGLAGGGEVLAHHHTAHGVIDGKFGFFSTCVRQLAAYLLFGGIGIEGEVGCIGMSICNSGGVGIGGKGGQSPAAPMGGIAEGAGIDDIYGAFLEVVEGEGGLKYDGVGHGVGIAAQIAIPDSWYTREDLLLLPLKDEILSARIGLVSLKERQYAPFMTDFMKTAVSSIRDTYKRIDALRGR